MKIVAVKDRALDAYGQPIFVRALGEALRSFSDEVNKGRESTIGQHPEDYDLYEIGDYEDREGKLIPCSPRLLLRGQDVGGKSPPLA